LPTRGKKAPYFCALGVPDERAAKRQLAHAIHYGFVDEVKMMATDLERFIEAKPGTVKMETMSERLASYKELRRKVEVYSDLLEMQHGDIQKALDLLTEKARAIVLGGEPATAPEKGKVIAQRSQLSNPSSEIPDEPRPPAASSAETTMKHVGPLGEEAANIVSERESTAVLHTSAQTAEVQNRFCF
jgi:hypothetical protein